MAVRYSEAAAQPVTRELVTTFADEVFADLPRVDQRRWARVYLEGLLAVRGRKSVRQVAAAASGSATASQSLQQFVNASTWDWAPVRQALARRVGELTTARAWSIRTVVLPKRGEHSCGVHRRFVPAAGRILNCQLGVGAFLSADEGDLPLEWGLLLPEEWGADRLRERARVPDDARQQPLWAQVLDLVDSVAGGTASASLPVVVDMSDDPDAALLVDGLSRRRRGFLVAVPPTLPVLPAGSRGTADSCAADSSAAKVAPPGPETAARSLLARGAPYLLAGDRAGHTRARSCLARLPGGDAVHRLVGKQTSGAARTPPVWLTNLDGRPDQLLAVARLQSRSAVAAADLARDHGMSDFEGRSFPGWHHHMTLVSTAYAYRRLIEPLASPGEVGEPLLRAG